MKIFIVARGVPSAREPQWGNFEFDQALALKELGHDVVVLSVDTRFRKYYRKYGITKELCGEIPHYNLFAGSIWSILRKISVSLHKKYRRFCFLILFKRVVKQEGTPDLIYTHYLSNSSMALVTKTKFGIPLVGIEHWSELGYSNIKPSVKRWAESVYKNLDCLITVSSTLKENIKRNFCVDSIVVNNMVGREFLYTPNDKDGTIVRFVTTGNLLPVKGFDNLILAFNQLSLPSDAWSLDIIGGGKERDNLMLLIEKLGLSDNIHLCGRKSRSGVIEMLNRSDVYIMSSRSETFGVAAIEALACGLPVISTDCGGARDFLTHDNGLLCPVNDVSKLSEAIYKMYNSYKEYDRNQIAIDCQKRFSSDAIGKKLESIFVDVIRRSKKE